MRLRNIEIDSRLAVKLNKAITSKGDNISGIMAFGQENDYPQIMEKLISGSTTAKAVADVYAKFLVGGGFEDENLNSIVIGKDARSKSITLLQMMRMAAQQVAYHNGFYIHVNMNLERKVVNSKPIPFKNCRFNRVDDYGYSAKIGVYNNWQKDKYEKYDPKKIQWYHIFNTNETAFASIVNNYESVDKFPGMVFFQFLDNQFFYPLSPFDSCYLDCDTESQIGVFKNRTIRSGFSKKTIFMIAAESDDELDKIEDKIKNLMGADGDTAMILQADIDAETGKVNEDKNLATKTIESTIDDKLFENWENNIANNIRKAMKAMPAILIDYEESKLGTTSGEAIIQATNFYNAMTQDDRALISNSFKELYSNFKNDYLAKATNWNIKPLNLYANNTTTV